MQWSELFGKENEPSFDQVSDFINSSLLDNLNNHIQQTFMVKPKLSYSGCAMNGGMWKGWNIKYQKSGKSLCTLYPKQGYLLLLVSIGQIEMNEAELVISQCTEYTQNLFKQTAIGHTGGTSLAFEVKNESILQDVKNLIALRVKKKAA